MTIDKDFTGVVLDSFLVDNVIPDIIDDEHALFEELLESTAFTEVHHKGGPLPRLMAIQGFIDKEGRRPIYRHPLDDEPEMTAFTSIVETIRLAVVDRISKYKEMSIHFNHALIQLYRSGEDSISEHADKTIDVARDSVIANFSIGSKRTIILRDKDKGKQPREAHRVPLKSNSVFVLGLATNRNYVHEIKRDRRRTEEKDDEERGEAFDGARISITFRDVSTFVDDKTGALIGQGAAFGLADDGALLKAFRDENTSKTESEVIYSQQAH